MLMPNINYTKHKYNQLSGPKKNILKLFSYFQNMEFVMLNIKIKNKYFTVFLHYYGYMV